MDRTQVIKELKAIMDAFKEECDAHPVCIEEAIRLLEMSYDDNVISRQAAIESIMECAEAAHSMHDWDMEQGYLNAIECIEEEPPAQPEIIHCGDCRYKDDGIDEDGTPFLKCLHGRSYGGTRINDFCSWAERRTDDPD